MCAQCWLVRELVSLRRRSPLTLYSLPTSALLGHPFDLTKTRLQTANPGTYTGGLDVVKKTLARDGPAGLYRGVVPPLLGVTPIFAISFWVSSPKHRACFVAADLWLGLGIRCFQATIRGVHTESRRSGTFNARARHGGFPVCNSYDPGHRTGRARQSPLTGESPQQ